MSVQSKMARGKINTGVNVLMTARSKQWTNIRGERHWICQEMLTSVSNVDVQGHPLLTNAEQSSSGECDSVRDEKTESVSIGRRRRKKKRSRNRNRNRRNEDNDEVHRIASMASDTSRNHQHRHRPETTAVSSRIASRQHHDTTRCERWQGSSMASSAKIPSLPHLEEGELALLELAADDARDVVSLSDKEALILQLYHRAQEQKLEKALLEQGMSFN